VHRPRPPQRKPPSRNPKAVPKALARKDNRSAKTAHPVPTIAAAVANNAKVVLPETVPRVTAVPVVTVVKEDAPVAAAPSKWPPRSNSKS
jgi:hypothetical protein